MPPSLSELTPMVFDMRLTDLGSEASISYYLFIFYISQHIYVNATLDHFMLYLKINISFQYKNTKKHFIVYPITSSIQSLQMVPVRTR